MVTNHVSIFGFLLRLFKHQNIAYIDYCLYLCSMKRCLIGTGDKKVIKLKLIRLCYKKNLKRELE